MSAGVYRRPWHRAYRVNRRRYAWVGTSSVTDTTPPGLNVTSVDVTKISRIAGKDVSVVDFSADEDFVEYDIRIVSSGSDNNSAGTRVETSTVTARSSHQISITDDELVAASASEGINIVKVFVKDAAGNWST